MKEAELAKKRLVFEEFFVFSAGVALMRASRTGKRVAPYENTYRIDITIRARRLS